MRKNRKTTKKMSVMARTTMRFGAIIVIFAVMAIFYMLSSTSCNQLLKQKCLLERELAKLDDSYMRESTRWEEMKTPERIERELLRHGLMMKLPKHDQNVQLKKDGSLLYQSRRVVAATKAKPVSVAAVNAVPTERRRKVRR